MVCVQTRFICFIVNLHLKQFAPTIYISSNDLFIHSKKNICTQCMVMLKQQNKFNAKTSKEGPTLNSRPIKQLNGV